jgi:hypothetical protein
MIGSEGQVLNTSQNVEALRKLWLGRELVEGYYVGPGDPGDFDPAHGMSDVISRGQEVSDRQRTVRSSGLKFHMIRCAMSTMAA